jgi:hypothetical protein
MLLKWLPGGIAFEIWPILITVSGLLLRTLRAGNDNPGSDAAPLNRSAILTALRARQALRHTALSFAARSKTFGQSSLPV